MPQRNGSPRFYELLDEMRDIHERKNADYSPGTDPFRNFRRCEKIGIPAFVGAYTRLGDKIERSETLIANVLRLGHEDAAVIDETLIDTLLDAANYFLIVACLYEEYAQDGGDDNIYALTPHGRRVAEYLERTGDKHE